MLLPGSRASWDQTIRCQVHACFLSGTGSCWNRFPDHPHYVADIMTSGERRQYCWIVGALNGTPAPPMSPAPQNVFGLIVLGSFRELGTNVDFGHSDPDWGCRLIRSWTGRASKAKWGENHAYLARTRSGSPCIAGRRACHRRATCFHHLKVERLTPASIAASGNFSWPPVEQRTGKTLEIQAGTRGGS